MSAQIGTYAQQNAIIIQENETIGYTLNHMIKYHLRHIPIINDDYKLVGILTAMDILRTLVERQNIDFLRFKNHEVMSKIVYSVNTTNSLKNTLLTMKLADLSAIPVVSDSNNIDGIFTAKDVVFLDNLWDKIPDSSITCDKGPGRPVDKTEIVSNEISIWEAIVKIHQQRSKYLFINNTKDGVFSGVISVEKILGVLIPMLMFGKADINVFKQRKIDSIVREEIKTRELPALVKPLRMWMRNQGIEIVVLLENKYPVKIMAQKHLINHLIDYL